MAAGPPDPPRSARALADRVALVTGAGRGIGRAEAIELAAHGARVVVNDLDHDPAAAVVAEIAAAGGEAIAHGGDVASWAGAASLVRAAIEQWGRLDIAVNNAGILRDGMSFKLSEDEWDDVIRVHLRGHAAVASAVGRHWRERSKAGDPINGRLVNTTSEAGLYGLPGQLNYVAAKSGIAAMTVALSQELARYGATVNAVAPRARTRMTEPVLGASVAPPATGFDEWDPANIAPVVAWLAGDAAADVNGEVFVVFANQVHRMTGWSLVASIETDGRWTVDALTARVGELLAGAGVQTSTS